MGLRFALGVQVTSVPTLVGGFGKFRACLSCEARSANYRLGFRGVGPPNS